MKGVTLTWLTFIAVQTYHYERANPAKLPPPKLYVGSALTFSLLMVAGQVAPGPATAMGVALVVAAGVRDQFANSGNPLDLTKGRASSSTNTGTGSSGSKSGARSNSGKATGPGGRNIPIPT